MNIFFTFQKHKLASNDSAIKKRKNYQKNSRQNAKMEKYCHSLNYGLDHKNPTKLLISQSSICNSINPQTFTITTLATRGVITNRLSI